MTTFSHLIPIPAVAAALSIFIGNVSAEDAGGGTAATTTLTFEDAELGEVSDELAFVIDGDFQVVARGDSRVLEVAATPLTESGALVGTNIEGDVEISAKVHATKKGRSYPRFGIGTHGMSGYRLRVVPARKTIELVYREKPVAEVPFTWVSDSWLHLKLSVKKTGDETWAISGKAWAEGEEEPEKANLEHADKDLRGKGKSSVWGTPYSGTAIAFDDVVVTGSAGS